MTRDLSEFTENPYDLIVVGGGINGAAIANIAAGRGLKVVLLEKNDFGSGTSSKSTKLVHGGFRYLENLEFDLVRESLIERYIQLQTAPHLVKPLPFIIPVYIGDKRPLWMMRLGVFLYDLLAGKYRIGQYKNLKRKEVLDLEHNLKSNGLVGGVMYFDAQMDDARLCLENILSARDKGAHVANYAEVLEFIKEGDRAVGVKVSGRFSQKAYTIKGKKIICATGPWTNQLLRLDNPQAKKKLRTTKGIHIVYRGRLTEHALLIPAGSDKRVFFVIPWMGNSLIGTTDTDYLGPADNVKAESQDIDYLFKEAARVFPSIDFKEEDIIATFAGLRPLVRRGGVTPSKVSRKHDLFETPSGIFCVIGGKFTTYRKIAQETVNAVTGTKPKPEEKTYPLYGSGKIAEKPEDIAKHYHLEIQAAEALLNKYGARYSDVLSLLSSNSSYGERFCACNPFIKAQIAYSITAEMAQTPQDIIERRLSIDYIPCASKECQYFIEKFFAEFRK